MVKQSRVAARGVMRDLRADPGRAAATTRSRGAEKKI